MTQFNEDEDILWYFGGRVGRFLDVGAGDGLRYSNTEPLLRAGWSGVMIEPAISQLRWLIQNHGKNERVEIIPAALLTSEDPDGVYVLRDGGDYSSFSLAHAEKISKHSNGNVTFRERKAACIHWGDVFGCFEFINIDVEGMNTELLRELPFERLKPEMICIEIDPESDLPEMMDICNRNGLGYAKRVGGNLLCARKEIR